MGAGRSPISGIILSYSDFARSSKNGSEEGTALSGFGSLWQIATAIGAARGHTRPGAVPGKFRGETGSAG